MLLDDTRLTAATLPPASLLSETGRQTLRATAATIASTPAAQQLLRTAQHGAALRAMLDLLAQDLATGDVLAAQTRLQTVLASAQAIDAAHARVREAQTVAQRTLAAVPAQALDAAHAIPPAQLGQLHASASAVAAAFDDLAVAAQAWAELIDQDAPTLV